jgi:hypothetical protein
MSPRDLRSPATVHPVYVILDEPGVHHGVLAGNEDLLEMLQSQCDHNDPHWCDDREQDPPRGTHERAAREARCEPDPAGIVALSPRRPLGWAPGLGRIGRHLGAMDHPRPECHGDHPHATATGDIPQHRRV